MGELNHPAENQRWFWVTQDSGVELMVRWLGVYEAAAVKECKDEFGAYIT